ncbi:MAG: TlpA family protein disulfide reductase, partial [Comamonadaceae bacterium]
MTSRRGALQVLAAGGMALALPARAAEIQNLSKPLAGFSAPDLQGAASPIPAKGKPTVVNFWATWCPPCRAEMPLLLQMADLYGDKFVLQLVNFKERALTVQRYMQGANWNHPVLFDAAGAGAGNWEVKTFPTTFGFDAQGRARWRVRGEYDWSSPEAGRLVESLWTS